MTFPESDFGRDVERCVYLCTGMALGSVPIGIAIGTLALMVLFYYGYDRLIRRKVRGAA